jgi:excisionase family DNA binding protein
MSRSLRFARHEIAIREACVAEGYKAMGRSNAMERRLTMTVEEAAEIIGISRTSAYLCAARGELPARRFGRRVLVLVAPLLAMLGDEPGKADETDWRVDEESAVPAERTRKLAYRSAAAASATSCS